MDTEPQSYTWRDDLYYIDYMVNGEIGHRREIIVSWFRFWITYWFSLRDFKRPQPNRLVEDDHFDEL